MCQQVVTAVRELTQTYEGKVDMEVEACAPENKALMEEHMGDAKHGLMVYDGDGELQEVLPGHAFGKDEIVKLIEEKL